MILTTFFFCVATRYASADGTGTAPCTTQANPCSLPTVVGISVGGDTIELAPGVYSILSRYGAVKRISTNDVLLHATGITFRRVPHLNLIYARCRAQYCGVLCASIVQNSGKTSAVALKARFGPVISRLVGLARGLSCVQQIQIVGQNENLFF